MAKKGNFVYIHRKIMDWEWYKDPNTFRVFYTLFSEQTGSRRDTKADKLCEGRLLRHIGR